MDFKVSPVDHFQKYFAEAEKAQLPEPNAMSVATIGLDGRPANRVVLYKGMIRGAFSFFTNYESRKGLELEKNPCVAAVFFWPQLSQQIRIEGRVEKLSRQESEEYFASRPRLSQLGAWASAQSRVIPNYDYFKNRIQQATDQFADQNSVPCPPHWGGYGLFADKIEFWFGLQGRLHERYQFVKQDQQWQGQMLSP
ncbi:MAG: pyridoxamine 5'-phosphate oxidase [Pseudobdellovibrionaceae bacterium]